MKPTRWGHVAEIDRRVRVGTVAFQAQPERLQQLQAWRAMHALRSHNAIRQYARRREIKPSSDLPLPAKVAYVASRI
jgi:hypothetical protein